MNKQLWYETGAKRHWLKRRPAPTVCSSGRVYQKPDISMFVVTGTKQKKGVRFFLNEKAKKKETDL